VSEQEEEEGWYNGYIRGDRLSDSVSERMCCSSVEYSPHIWYIDNGASSHIIGIREHFSNLRDTEVNIDISLGDNMIVIVAGIGTVSFRRENLPPISFTDVLFVPGMKNNLISVSTLQDRGFEVLI
jgi:hypothetical protein